MKRLLLAIALLAVACGGQTADDQPQSLGQVQPTGTVARADFCADIDPAAVRAALGGADTIESVATWQPGDARPRGTQPTNEFGCEWQSGDRRAAAWVVAAAIHDALAAQLADSLNRDGCTARHTANQFGDPSWRQSCQEGEQERIRRAGRFGQTWLSCEVVGPADLVDAWCVAAFNAASAD